MAAEALADKYLFNVSPTKKVNTGLSFKIPTLEEVREVSGSRHVDKAVFVYNPLHDLESLWWILVYVLFFNEDEEHPCPDSQARQAQMNVLFSGEMDTTARKPFFENCDELPHALAYLASTFAAALEILREIAQFITSAYFEAERSYPNINTEYFSIHTSVMDALNTKQHRDMLRSIQLVSVKQTIEPPADQPEVARRDGKAKAIHSLENADETEESRRKKLR